KAPRLEHFPPKAWPGLDPGWAPVRRRKCDKRIESRAHSGSITLERDSIRVECALMPRTRSSHTYAASPIANFGFKRGIRIICLLVSFRFRSSHESVPQYVANFGIGTLGNSRVVS